LIHYVARLVEDMEMPPPGKGEPLTNDKVGLLRPDRSGVVWSTTDAGVAKGPQFSISRPSVDERERERAPVPRTLLDEGGWSGGLDSFSLKEVRRRSHRHR
jgi:hypothetical protein